jgi:hypothetical protein
MKEIGRIDKVDFPELKLKNISVKVDTGAYTSSIHCHHVKEVIKKDKKYLEFQLLDPSHPKFNDKLLKAKKYKEKNVKSSFGSIQKRFIIETTIVIYNKEYPIELSLTNRSDMKFPILLGRKFLNHKFIVNTSLKNLSFKVKKGKIKKK